VNTVGTHTGSSTPSDVAGKQPVAVLAERARVPHGRVHGQAHEPAEQQVVVELLHQLRLGADRIERLQQERPQQPLGWNRRPPAIGVDLGELAIERCQHIIDDAPDHPQRMLRRNTVLEINIREQATRPLVRTPHPSLPQLAGIAESYSVALVS
jgi:hypothetical protein